MYLEHARELTRESRRCLFREKEREQFYSHAFDVRLSKFVITEHSSDYPCPFNRILIGVCQQIK